MYSLARSGQTPGQLGIRWHSVSNWKEKKKNFVTGKFTIHHDLSAQLQMSC